MSKVTTIIFPNRAPSGATNNAQPKLPSCRAWRIVPMSASDLSSDKAAVVNQKATAAPTGCKDGIFPVWVKATRHTDDSEIASLVYVDHNGWNSQAMGKNWTIEYVGTPNTDTDAQQYAYVVETVDHLDDAGQVNGSLDPPAPSLREIRYIVSANLTVPVILEWVRPRWARSGVLRVHPVYTNGNGGQNVGGASTVRILVARDAPGGGAAGTPTGRALYLGVGNYITLPGGNNLVGFADEPPYSIAYFGTEAGSNTGEVPTQLPNTIYQAGPPPDRIIVRADTPLANATVGAGIPIWMDWGR